MQGTKKIIRKQKRCVYCRALFMPDVRSKGCQRACSKTECQRKRQRANEREWRLRNLDCLSYQHEQSKAWHRRHPYYSRKRREENPELLLRNREQSRQRMRRIRGKKMFDKSKSILKQLVGGKTDKCYLTQGGRGIYVCLTKSSPLTRQGSLSYNRREFKRVANCLPKSKLYNLVKIFS